MRRSLEHAGLQGALRACARYFFLGAGDWADALVRLLCASRLGQEPLLLHGLGALLDAAVQVRTVIQQPSCDRLIPVGGGAKG